jgi:hypothetical protein
VTTVTADGTLHGPPIPSPAKWLVATRVWWDSWRRAPQASAFTGTDWQRLTMLLPLVDGYFRKPHHLMLAEIRLNESLLGATYVDRLKARIKVESAKPTATVPAGVTVLDEYRNSVAG